MESEALISDQSPGGGFSYCVQTTKKYLSYITVEPAVFMMVFAYGISLNVTPTLLLDRCCRTDYGFPSEVCDELKDHPEELNTCQIWSNKMVSSKMVGQAIPNAIVALFSGAWTDKYGRKLGLLIPLFFSAMEYLFYLFFALYDQLSDEWYTLSAVTGLGGGLPLFLASTFSYITDISSVEQRNLRVSLVDGSLFVGLPLGTLLSGMLLNKIHFVGIFSLSIICITSSFIYLLIRIKETRSPPAEGTLEEPSSMCLGIQETFGAIFKKRPARTAMVLLMATMFLYTSTNVVNVYYYTMRMYKWTEETYSYFFAIVVAVDGFFSYIVYPYIMGKFKVSDPTLGIVGEISALGRSFILAYSFNTNIFFLGYAVGIFGSYTSVVLRSTISKITPKENIGKVFAVIGALEALVPSLSSTVFTYIYDQAIDTYPGWIFIAITVVHCSVIIILLIVHFIFSKVSNQNWLMELYGN